MTSRTVAVALVISALMTAPAPAQLPEILGMGYVGLTVGSTVRLLEGDCCATARVGSEVRGTLDQDGRRTGFGGRILSMTADSIAVASDSTTWRVARRDMRGTYVNSGRERQWAKGWGLGLLGFSAFGAALGYAAGSSSNGGDISLGRGGGALLGAVVLGIPGSVLIAGLGALVTEVRWKRVDRWDEGTGQPPR